MNFCIDALELEEPVFEFNLLKLLSGIDNSYPSESFGAMIKVETDSLEYPVIYDQKPGKLMNHKFDLPPFYQGELEIEILLANGDISSESYLENRDAILFDDFKLYNKPDINLEYDKYGFIIYPNPTNNIIRVINQSPDLDYEVSVFDGLGKLIHLENNVNQTWIDLSSYPSGIYFVSFKANGHIITTHKVVKY